MENQHQQIKGYRDLTQAEIDLMNRIKAHAELTHQLCEAVKQNLSTTTILPHDTQPATSPARWISIAQTDFQTGFMALTRAVARPTTF